VQHDGSVGELELAGFPLEHELEVIGVDPPLLASAYLPRPVLGTLGVLEHARHLELDIHEHRWFVHRHDLAELVPVDEYEIPGAHAARRLQTAHAQPLR
jgi:hypothetical protein